ncbi:matrilin-2-like [Ictalurus furcatus]|uniref:matrilin-2-like n=1 Tax=Ictalurus furcatus TaxID=66913 RepID=UPI00234FD269|nr:matrilin-2-like [Ictalurus furcatus]
MDSYRPVILFSILISFHVGHTLRCACKEDLRTCTSIYNMQTNFKTAQKICMEKGGKLLTPLSKTIDSFLFNKTGHFWIGSEGDCLSSSRNSRGDSVTLNRGGENVACSSRCMSVSSNKTLMERSCEEQVDGFLCDGIQWENCWEERASEVQILNKKDCGLGPCEHQCEEVPGGHMCTCYNPDLFRPSRKNPERCEYYCDSTTCKQLCSMCECPDGFIKDEANCTDLDECKSNHTNCEQKCRNTIGSYMCSCHEGFMLVNKTKCVPLINPTPLTAELVTPSVNYTLSHAVFATPAEYIGFTLLILLAICVLIGLLYYLRKSKSDVLLKNNDIADDIMVQEARLQM